MDVQRIWVMMSARGGINRLPLRGFKPQPLEEFLKCTIFKVAWYIVFCSHSFCISSCMTCLGSILRLGRSFLAFSPVAIWCIDVELRTFALRQDRIGDGNAAKKAAAQGRWSWAWNNFCNCRRQTLLIQINGSHFWFWSFPIELHTQWSDSLSDFWRLQKGREFWLNSGRTGTGCNWVASCSHAGTTDVVR